MRVLLATDGSHGDVEPLAGLAVQLRALGAQVHAGAPSDQDLVELLARVELPLMPIGRPMRSMVPPTSPAEVTERVTELISTQYDTIVAAAAGCDLVVATGLSHFAARSAAEKRGAAAKLLLKSLIRTGATA